jgi:hypothetical protein
MPPATSSTPKLVNSTLDRHGRRQHHAAALLAAAPDRYGRTRTRLADFAGIQSRHVLRPQVRILQPGRQQRAVDQRCEPARLAIAAGHRVQAAAACQQPALRRQHTRLHAIGRQQRQLAGKFVRVAEQGPRIGRHPIAAGRGVIHADAQRTQLQAARQAQLDPVAAAVFLPLRGNLLGQPVDRRIERPRIERPRRRAGQQVTALSGGIAQGKDQVIGCQCIIVVGIGAAAPDVAHIGIQVQPVAVRGQQQLAALVR